MPSPYVKNLAKETSKSEKEIEKLWDKAKKIAAEEFGKSEDDFSNKEFAYVTGIVKNMLGIDESILDPTNFLNSDLSAQEFLETVVSGNFSIGNVIPPDEDEDEDSYSEEEEEDEEDEEVAYYNEYKVPTAPEKEESVESDVRNVELSEEELQLLNDLKNA